MPSLTVIENWIEYENLSFGEQSLGEVVAFLECLQTETEEFPHTVAIPLNPDNKRRIIAQWHNAIAIARMKKYLPKQHKLDLI